MPISNPTDIAGCTVWLAADLLSLSDGDPISSATDGTGAAAWTQTGANRPTYKTAITPTGKPVMRFVGSSDQNLLGPDLSALTSGSVFVVVKINTDPPLSSQNSGLWVVGTAASTTHYPFTDGVIYEGALSTVRFTTTDPTLSLSSAFRIYRVRCTAGGAYGIYLDGVLHYSTTGVTVGLPAIPVLGHSSATAALDGDIAAFLVYNSSLSDPNCSDVETYLSQRYITGTGAVPSSFQGNAFQPNAFQEGSFFNPQLVTPGTLALALTPFTPTVATPRLVTPGTLALVLTPFAPTVLAYHNQSGFQTSFQTDAFQVGWQFNFVGAVPGTLALTLTPFTPTVVATANQFVTPGTKALVLTMFVPTAVATANKFVVPGTLALTLTPFTPSVVATGAGKKAKNYGSGAEVMPQAPFKWSKAWEQKFAEDRMLAERERAQARFDDFDAFVLQEWQKQEDEDLLLAASGYPW